MKESEKSAPSRERTGSFIFRFLQYVLTHPWEAARTFWKAFTDRADPNERIIDAEAQMHLLRVAIGFYKIAFGRLPSILEDLCFNNHNDPAWDTPFIHWRGSDTFHDTFGFPYQYSCENGAFTLFSPGLEAAKKYPSVTK